MSKPEIVFCIGYLASLFLLRNLIYHIKQYIGFFRAASLGVRPKGPHLLKKILTPSNLNLWLVSPTFGPVIMTLWCFWVWLLWNFNEPVRWLVYRLISSASAGLLWEENTVEWLISPAWNQQTNRLNESSSLSISEWSWPCGCFYFHLVRFGQH